MHRSNERTTDRSKSGADFLQLHPAEAPPGGLTDWLAGALRAAVADGRLPVGTRLPATRALAADLGVSRGVVAEAYRRLAEDGHVGARTRAGTVVLAAPPSASAATVPQPAAPIPDTASGIRPQGTSWAAAPARAPAPASAAGPDAGSRPAPAAAPGRRRTAGTQSAAGPRPAARPGTRAAPGPGAAARPACAPAAGRPAPGPSPATSFAAGGAGVFPAAPEADVFDALRGAPARVDLTPGVPDLAAFPRAAWLRAEREVLADLPAARLGYGDPRGAPELRGAIAEWLARYRGIAASAEDVIVTAGTGQTLTLLGRVLAAGGVDAVAVEDPGSLGARQHLAHVLSATPPVPVDAEGVVVSALAATGARAVLLTPAHQFPTGVVLSGGRRRELLAWAAGGGLVVEDDYDAEHRYDRPPVPALKAALPDSVVYAGSVSKLLAPALRTGWVLAPRPFHDALVTEKRFTDLGNPAPAQLVLARLMRSGGLERQLRVLRRRHRRRRDALTAAVRAHLPGAVVHGAAAGLHLTVTFGGHARFADIDLAAASLDRGVKVQPLSWHRQRPGPPGLVLGYAAASPDVLTAAMAEVGAALRRVTVRACT